MRTLQLVTRFVRILAVPLLLAGVVAGVAPVAAAAARSPGPAASFTNSGAAAATPRATPPGTKLAVLKGAGTVQYDNFGFAVAISGKTAVVADNASFPGGQKTPPSRVWVFTKTAAGWKQAAVLAPPITGPSPNLSVAVSGTTVVVGAQFAQAAYVFTKTATGWKETAVLKVPAYSVAISGKTIFVGDPGNNQVHVFTETTSGWKQTTGPKAPAVAAAFGWSEAVSGTTLVVGAPATGTGAGQAFVFAKTAAGWKQTAELKGAPGGGGGCCTEGGAFFGWSVAISGTTVVVGEPHRNPALSGRAYVFAKTGAGWKQTAVAKGPPVATLGSVVGISGNTFVANQGGYGARVVTKTAAGWKQIATLKISGGAGSAVAISGSLAIEEAPSRVTGKPPKAIPGSVYVFEA